MIKPKTHEQLQEAKQRQQELYRLIDNVVPPVGWNCKIFIGGCVERGVGSSFRARAHAHNFQQRTGEAEYFGWICVRSIKRIGDYHIVCNDNGSHELIIDKPSNLLKHEYAHILTPNHWHDDTWRKALRELGGRIEAQYKKKIK